jgi:hypothetical protein
LLVVVFFEIFLLAYLGEIRGREVRGNLDSSFLDEIEINRFITFFIYDTVLG